MLVGITVLDECPTKKYVKLRWIVIGLLAGPLDTESGGSDRTHQVELSFEENITLTDSFLLSCAGAASVSRSAEILPAHRSG